MLLPSGLVWGNIVVNGINFLALKNKQFRSGTALREYAGLG